MTRKTVDILETDAKMTDERNLETGLARISNFEKYLARLLAQNLQLVL
jgi:hypothetical protein